MSHTPGPWHQGTTDAHWKREVRDAEGTPVAWCGSFPEEQAHANARLISAAPEMLAELRSIRGALAIEDALDPQYGWGEWIAKRIDPLIAKAEGKT
jgi:hypothetical protein